MQPEAEAQTNSLLLGAVDPQPEASFSTMNQINMGRYFPSKVAALEKIKKITLSLPPQNETFSCYYVLLVIESLDTSSQRELVRVAAARPPPQLHDLKPALRSPLDAASTRRR